MESNMDKLTPAEEWYYDKNRVIVPRETPISFTSSNNYNETMSKEDFHLLLKEVSALEILESFGVRAKEYKKNS